MHDDAPKYQTGINIFDTYDLLLDIIRYSIIICGLLSIGSLTSSVYWGMYTIVYIWFQNWHHNQFKKLLMYVAGPQLIMSIYGLDMFDHDVIEGYGVCHLPLTTGYHEKK